MLAVVSVIQSQWACLAEDAFAQVGAQSSLSDNIDVDAKSPLQRLLQADQVEQVAAWLELHQKVQTLFSVADPLANEPKTRRLAAPN